MKYNKASFTFFLIIPLKKTIPTIILIFVLLANNILAQKSEPLDSAKYSTQQEKFKTKILPSLIAPTLLISYGLSTINNNGWYSSYDAKRDINKNFKGFHTKADNVLIFVPHAEFIGLTLLGVKGKNDLLNTSLLILKAELIKNAIVLPLKYFSHQLRPDSSNYNSLPSGHTAEAFLAATIVHKEFKHQSIWYSIGAYTVAASVATLRMLNNRHWESDVFVGAGIGILSVNIAYATHQYKWRSKEISFVPIVNNKNKGFLISYQF